MKQSTELDSDMYRCGCIQYSIYIINMVKALKDMVNNMADQIVFEQR